MKKVLATIATVALALGMFTTGMVGATQEEDKGMGGMFMGTVQQIGQDNLTMKMAFTEFMTAKVILSPDCKYLDLTSQPEEGKEPPALTKADIKVGDKIVCKGKIAREEGKDAVFTALTVGKVKEFPKPRPPQDDKGDRKPQIMGVFVSATDTAFTMKAPDSDKTGTFNYNEKTKFVRIAEKDGKKERQNITIKDIKSGDKLVVVAVPLKDKEGDDKERVMTAVIVTVVDKFPELPPPGEGRREERRPTAIGSVKSFDGKNLTVELWKNKDIKTAGFTVDEKTKVLYFPKQDGDKKPEPVEKKLEDLKPGQKVMVDFRPNEDTKPEDGVIAGLAIRIVLIDEFPPEVAMGEIVEISASSVTINARVDKENTEKVTIQITSDTKFVIMKRGEKPQEAKLSDFAKGDKVAVDYRDGKALVIKKVMVPEKK